MLQEVHCSQENSHLWATECFGPSLISWFQTFYKNIESCVLNNGWASCFIQLQRGVRQGCPLSPYLFILSAEILAKAIRSNKNIKGISVNNSEIKISQYADDTTFILNGTSESLSATLQTIETFGSMSGLRLNSKKTEALWIGSMVGNKEKLFFFFFPRRTLNGQKTK